jgi:hypothetical protein
LSESWKLAVALSATSEVSSESMEPRAASTSAVLIMSPKRSTSMTGSTGDGRAEGISPSTGTSKNSSDSTVPAVSASNGEGSTRPMRRGVKKQIAIATAPISSAEPLIAAPPAVALRPSRGSICISSKMPPMPVMKPEITGYGMRFT